MINKQIDVTVVGEDPDAVQLVTGVINKALLDNSFNNVGVLNSHTGEPTLIPDVPSLYDLIKHEKPHLFSQPVTVTGLTVPKAENLQAFIDQHSAQLEKNPNTALGRYCLGSGLLDELQRDEEELVVAVAKTKKVKAEPQPSAAELSDAAKTLSKAAHKDDHHPAKDSKAVAEKLAAKAMDAA